MVRRPGGSPRRRGPAAGSLRADEAARARDLVGSPRRVAAALGTPDLWRADALRRLGELPRDVTAPCPARRRSAGEEVEMRLRVARGVAGVLLAIVVLALPCGAQAEGTGDVGSNEIKWGKVLISRRARSPSPRSKRASARPRRSSRVGKRPPSGGWNE